MEARPWLERRRGGQELGFIFGFFYELARQGQPQQLEGEVIWECHCRRDGGLLVAESCHSKGISLCRGSPSVPEWRNGPLELQAKGIRTALAQDPRAKVAPHSSSPGLWENGNHEAFLFRGIMFSEIYFEHKKWMVVISFRRLPVTL